MSLYKNREILFLIKFFFFIRILRGVDGQFFADTLRKVRKILKMENDFSIVLDIEENKSSEKMFEEQFLERLQRYKGSQTEALDNNLIFLRWNSKPNFRPRKYTDLEGLPVILIVVDKGKMGVTYPRSSNIYDLRSR